MSGMEAGQGQPPEEVFCPLAGRGAVPTFPLSKTQEGGHQLMSFITAAQKLFPLTSCCRKSIYSIRMAEYGDPNQWNDLELQHGPSQIGAMTDVPVLGTNEELRAVLQRTGTLAGSIMVRHKNKANCQKKDPRIIQKEKEAREEKEAKGQGAASSSASNREQKNAGGVRKDGKK